METQNTFKLLAIIATAVVGVYGTVFDFKKNGRVTHHGIIATTLIIAATVIAVVIHASTVNASRIERVRLQQENDRQQRILTTSLQVNSDIKNALAELQSVRSTVRASSKVLARQLARQFAQSEQIQKDVTRDAEQSAANLASLHKTLSDFGAAASLALARLARPLNDISFSYAVVYDRANERFPKYYRRLSKLQQMFEPNPQQPASGRLVLTGDEAYAHSNLDGREADAELNFETSWIGFRTVTAPDDQETQRQYEVTAWVPAAEKVMNRDVASGELRKMPAGVGIEIAADFDAHTITKRVEFAAVHLIQNDGAITSELDIVGPGAAKNLLVEIERRSQYGFQPPRLSELVIHINDGYDGSVFIPGSACQPSKWSDDAFTCTMTFASIGPPQLCPAEYAADDPMTQMFSPRCASVEGKPTAP